MSTSASREVDSSDSKCLARSHFIHNVNEALLFAALQLLLLCSSRQRPQRPQAENGTSIAQRSSG